MVSVQVDLWFDPFEVGVVHKNNNIQISLDSTYTSALNAKAPINNPTFTGTVFGVSKVAVGLGNVDNTTDAGKPISSLTQSALDLKAPLASPTFTGTINCNDVAISGTLSGTGITTLLASYYTKNSRQ